MTRNVHLAVRVAVTAVAVLLAVIGAHWLWVRYTDDPWTRDGRIRADVVLVSPDIAGLVTEVHVRDNMPCGGGRSCSWLDRPRYHLALDQAEAAIAAAQAALNQAVRENRRNRALGALVSAEQVEQGGAKVQQLSAQLAADIVQRNLARLNLERTTVRASVNGVTTNVELQPGDFASAGRQVLAIVNTDSLYVDGYFEETKLPRIDVGDPATVHIMGVAAELRGVVASIDAGIEDRERGPSGNGLANITPTFSWVRLAQRVPVRIHLTEVPPNVRLIAGRTVTVSIFPPAGRPPEGMR
ncbi:MAG: HlyD family efflux transporter periplasmic adaptor subunit [Rhizomicrobium sp.]